uniref:Uncharacterized protein n=1 Tax=Arundo donax TaxID=35708 RepID=A0A0A9A1D9_ARUDO
MIFVVCISSRHAKHVYLEHFSSRNSEETATELSLQQHIHHKIKNERDKIKWVCLCIAGGTCKGPRVPMVTVESGTNCRSHAVFHRAPIPYNGNVLPILWK